MIFILVDTCNSRFIQLDFKNMKTSGWQSSITYTTKHFKRSISDAKSWNCWDRPLDEQLDYFTENGYKVLYIDNLPFTKWQKTHPEYFI